MKRSILFLISTIFIIVACGSKSNNDAELLAPSNIEIYQKSNSEVIVTWKDNSSNEDSFEIYLKAVDNIQKVIELGSVDANITTYVIRGKLEVGSGYYIGVQSKNKTKESDIKWGHFMMLDVESAPLVNISSYKIHPTCFEVQYDFDIEQYQLEYGLCWAMGKTPTLKDNYQIGPDTYDGKVFQVLPNTQVEYGKDCHIRAYLKTPHKVFYSKEIVGQLKEETKPIKMEWKKLSLGLPEFIEVYETKSNLNGRVFNAWYAIADPEKVDVRVLMPGGYRTVDKQFAEAGDAYVMTNGGYFYNGQNIGVAVINSNTSGGIYQFRGTLEKQYAQEFNTTYYATRGLFGVDSKGSPKICWVATDKNNQACYYDRPLPSVVGHNKYAQVNDILPTNKLNWKPRYALTAGPVLLYNGNCPFDFSTNGKGKPYYISNYELIPYDIFDRGSIPDRTAIGYTKDGKVVLFVCDGRIKSSKGANLVELAQILKGIGCVDALNLDGGGSTAMVAAGNRLNSLEASMSGRIENRPVITTVGFFKKK